jgi:magnesium chelatase family protein
MNPCICGWLGHPTKECTCSPVQVQRYTSRLSGPLLDRIDMHIDVPPVPFKEITREQEAESSAEIKQRVDAARKVQRSRYQKTESVYCNAQMTSKQLKNICKLDAQSQSLLQQGIERLGLSARAYYRILKIARTIADLDGKKSITSSHVGEAIQYRRLDNSL